MTILSWMVLSLLIVMIVGTWKAIREWVDLDISLQFNMFNSPYFHIGISFDEYILRDRSVERELKIGVFIFSLSFVFWFPEEITA